MQSVHGRRRATSKPRYAPLRILHGIGRTPMIITALTERDGHVSYSSETALRREVANFIERGDGARMIVNARPSRAELDDDDEPLQEIDRSVACATLREAWAEVNLVLHHG